MITKKALRGCMSFYQELINYQRQQIEIFKSDGFTEDSSDLIIAHQTIEHFKQQIREAQITLKALVEKGKG